MRTGIFVASLALIVIIASSSISIPFATASPQELIVIPFFRKGDRNFDPFYRQTVTTFEAGTKIRVDVLVFNLSFFSNATVIEVGIRFDWMAPGLFTPSERCTRRDACIIPPGALEFVPVIVELPNSTRINESSHLYEARSMSKVEKKEEVSGSFVNIDFAVYSREQAQAVRLHDSVAQRLGLQSINLRKPVLPAPQFFTSEGEALRSKAVQLVLRGLERYSRGEFEEARDTFRDALSSIDDAIKKESEIRRLLEENQRGLVKAEADQASALKAQADSLSSQAEAFRAQAKALDDQARAYVDQARFMGEQARASENQAEAMRRQADALREQSVALNSQAGAMKAQSEALNLMAIGLTIGTILIGAALMVYALRAARKSI